MADPQATTVGVVLRNQTVEMLLEGPNYQALYGLIEPGDLLVAVNGCPVLNGDRLFRGPVGSLVSARFQKKSSGSFVDVTLKRQPLMGADELSSGDVKFVASGSASWSSASTTPTQSQSTRTHDETAEETPLEAQVDYYRKLVRRLEGLLIQEQLNYRVRETSELEDHVFALEEALSARLESERAGRLRAEAKVLILERQLVIERGEAATSAKSAQECLDDLDLDMRERAEVQQLVEQMEEQLRSDSGIRQQPRSSPEQSQAQPTRTLEQQQQQQHQYEGSRHPDPDARFSRQEISASHAPAQDMTITHEVTHDVILLLEEQLSAERHRNTTMAAHLNALQSRLTHTPPSPSDASAHGEHRVSHRGENGEHRSSHRGESDDHGPFQHQRHSNSHTNGGSDLHAQSPVTHHNPHHALEAQLRHQAQFQLQQQQQLQLQQQQLQLQQQQQQQQQQQMMRHPPSAKPRYPSPQKQPGGGHKLTAPTQHKTTVPKQGPSSTRHPSPKPQNTSNKAPTASATTSSPHSAAVHNNLRHPPPYGTPLLAAPQPQRLVPHTSSPAPGPLRPHTVIGIGQGGLSTPSPPNPTREPGGSGGDAGKIRPMGPNSLQLSVQQVQLANQRRQMGQQPPPAPAAPGLGRQRVV